MVNVNESNDFQSPTNNDPSSWSTRNGTVSSSLHSDPDLHSTQNDPESQYIQIDPDSESLQNDTEAQFIQNDPESNSTQNDPDSTFTQDVPSSQSTQRDTELDSIQNDPDSTLTQDVPSSQSTKKDTELDSIQNDPDSWSNITNPDLQCSESDSDPNSDTDTESIEDILISLPAQSDEELPFTEPDNEKQDRPTNKGNGSQFSNTDLDRSYPDSQNSCNRRKNPDSIPVNAKSKECHDVYSNHLVKLLNEKLKSQNKIMNDLLSDATDTMNSYGLEKRKQLQRIESLAKDQDLKKKEIKTLKRKLIELEATNVDLERRCTTREMKSPYQYEQNHSNYIPGIEYVLFLIQFLMNCMPGKAGADFPNPMDQTPIMQEERRHMKPPNRHNFQDRVCFQCKLKGHVVADCWKISNRTTLKNSRPHPRDEIWTRSWYPKKKYISKP